MPRTWPDPFHRVTARRALAGAAAGLLSAWLAGCAAPPQAQPEPVPASPEIPAPAPPLLPPLPQPSLAPRPGAAEPALRMHRPERGPQGSAGEPALRLPGPPPADEPPVLLASGTASWYADSLHGRRTANGERYDREEFTAAHRSLPFGARLCVRSLVNGRTVIVRVNDRGPFTPGRIIDLSRAAAEELGMMGLGIKSVELWRVGADEENCPDSLTQSVEGAGLGLDAAAADKALERPARRAPPPRKARRGKRHRR